MQLKINISIQDDDGKDIVSEQVEYIGNKSGIIHSIKPIGDALVYAAQLGVYLKKEVPLKDALGNTRSILKDVVDIKDQTVK